VFFRRRSRPVRPLYATVNAVPGEGAPPNNGQLVTLKLTHGSSDSGD
jgi:hypothetical protein